jgi:hypothetical protein
MQLRLLLLTVLLANGGMGWAQNDYRLFRPDVQYLYDNPMALWGVTSPILGMRLTDDACAQTYESLQYNPFNIFTSFGCFEVMPTFVGHQVCHTDSVTLFDFGVDDGGYGIRIRQQATLGEQWEVTDGQYWLGEDVYARVDAVVYEPVLGGLMDSVKYIGLYEVSAGGGLVPLDYAVPPIQISRQYGLLRGVFFQWMLLDYSVLELVGMRNPAVGWQNPSRDDVFDLHAGDEFHISRIRTRWVGSEDYAFVHIRERRRFVEQWMAAGQLHQVFDVDVKRWESGEIALPDTVFTFGRVDTLRLGWDELAYLDMQPGSLIIDNVGFTSYRSVLLEEDDLCPGVKKTSGHWLGNMDENGCLYGFPDAWGGPDYFSGMGGGYSDMGLPEENIPNLIYAALADGTTCGTPYDFTVGTREPAATLPLRAWPQPAANHLYVAWPPEGAGHLTLALYDARGQRLRDYDQAASGDRLDMSGLPSGVYVLRVMDGQWRGKVVRVVK